MDEETSKKARRHHSAELKTEAVRKAMSHRKTVAQVAEAYGIHPSHLQEWMKQAAKSILKGFQQRGGMMTKLEQGRQEIERLEKLVAQRDSELAWMREITQKALGPKLLAQLVDGDQRVSRMRQCELLGIKRTRTYYTPKKKAVMPADMKAAKTTAKKPDKKAD